MHLYDMIPYEGAQPGWYRTLAEAHADSRKVPRDWRSTTRITLRDYPANQQAVCDLFNGIRPEGKTLRVWRLTPRGGLFELNPDGSEPAAPDDPEPPAPPANHAEAADAFWSRLTAPKEK